MNFNPKHLLTAFSIKHYKAVALTVAIIALTIAATAILPSVKPEAFPFLNSIKVDTDPENMLSAEEPVRVFHNEMKKRLSLHDMLVVGIVNETDPNGVFNPATLKNIYDLTEYAKTLHWEKDGKQTGVIDIDIIAPSTVDNIEQKGLGTVNFQWLMPEPPTTAKQALEVRRKAQRIPFLNGTMVSEDGKAICIYIPLTSKNLSYKVSSALKEKIATFTASEQYHITGLPVAEDTFGVEMFKQMAISAPTAMIVIFLLMLLFFRKLIIIVSPMIVALVSVIITMGSLVITGFPVHIMSSMIPIFIMPIAVLDSIHIISEFFELYQQTKDRKTTILKVMDELFMPMLYTSLTSAAGFASLALTPIPPVQVFGIFIATGIMIAWALTVTFIPAYIMFINPKKLENFGSAAVNSASKDGKISMMDKILQSIGLSTYNRAKTILLITAVIAVIAVYGITLIQTNDNPVKWFSKSHPIRIADKTLNKHFGGTYMAYLTLSSQEGDFDKDSFIADFTKEAKQQAQEYKEDWPEAVKVFNQIPSLAASAVSSAKTRQEAFNNISNLIAEKANQAPDNQMEIWDEVSLFVSKQKQKNQLFKDPAVLKYISNLQQALKETKIVGKSNSLADIIKTVHRELFLGKEVNYKIPDTSAAVAQCMMTYQSSHRAGDMWHLVTPNYQQSSIWVQLKGGDNKDMTKAVDAIKSYVSKNPPPTPLKFQWFGLTYINLTWQDKMVNGMLQAFIGSFLVVFLMMTVLFGSAIWALLSMIPLTVTIAAIYGMIGLVGKDYDMPVAVLSSMTLGLAVDFAIHFLARSKQMYAKFGSWKETAPAVFAEPARAITRNVIVIAVGFLPLLLAPLIPYKTVGMLLATILLVSGIATLLLLPAIMTLIEKQLFNSNSKSGLRCNCTNCIVFVITLAALVGLTLHQSVGIAWNKMFITGTITALVALLLCTIVSASKKCKTSDNKEA